MKIVKNIIFGLFGLMFVNSGLNKFFNYMPMPELSEEMLAIFNHILALKWLMPLAGVIEILAGILIAIPKTRALGAAMLFPVMVGIVLHHLTLVPDGLIMVLVLFAINIWAIAENWTKFKPLFTFK